MSRSFKKMNIIKDSSGTKRYNKIFRKKNKLRLLYDFDLEPILIREAVNSYSVCDYKFFSKNKETLRK